ncbi:hypothetical protein [Yersinia ruckeri]|uniref:hypothetical protein n=1 Tax=Yersinia ruckeri TaxID=29486 RepID=UPI002238EA51|nr:hypothetical protein [Yersinia ruckeri]MCW6598715.1 hypothetical protein [Yersinia ruckeri]
MIITASKAYMQYKKPNETVRACMDRLHSLGNKVYKNGRPLTSLEVPLLSSITDVIVAMDVIPEGKNSISAFATPRFEMLPFNKVQRLNCDICKSNNSVVPAMITNVPGTICTICRATDFKPEIKEALAGMNLLESFDSGYQVAELVAN